MEINVLIGALTLEKWETNILLKKGTLDLIGLKRHEFTEFIAGENDMDNLYY